MSAVKIGSNISSMSAQRRLAEGTFQLSKVFERLSSGQRINRASDDAAGLSISESLKSDRRVFNQGVRNFNDGVSLLNIADGAISELSGIVIRLKELAEQSANGTYGFQQRKALDSEAQALSKEYFRIVQSTKFNGRHLFDANFGELRLQGGFGLEGGIQSGLGGAIGTGSFGQAASTTMPSSHNILYDITFGDLNGDGIPDMVTTGVGSVSIRMGLGDGSFGSATSYYTTEFGMLGGGTTRSVQLGDVNGDGILDIVTGESGYGYSWGVSVLLGKGDGTFGDYSFFEGSQLSVREIQLADLNGDGILDIATASEDVGSIAGAASIWLGNGDGTFASPLILGADQAASYAIELGDINGDGILDMITGGRYISYFGSGNVTIFLGRGDGTFGSAVSFQLDNDVSALALADLNGDGKLDLISAEGGGVNVQLGTGTGTFGSITRYQLEGTISDITLGDLNGDGILDLITAGANAGNGASFVMLGQGDGTFSTAVSYTTENTFSHAVTLSDLNNNGVLDIITAGGIGAGGSGITTARLADTTSGISPLLSFNLSTMSGARQALPVFDRKIQQLSEQRGTIGAFQSRLNVGTNVLQASSENYAAAEGRIRNVDIAEESSKLVRLNILQQAASSVLAQANLQPQLAIILLQSG